MDNPAKEIKRKFFLKSLPDLSGIIKEEYERYYLFRTANINLRVQRINDRYELERLTVETALARNKAMVPLSKAEFDLLKTSAKEHINRDSYALPGAPTTCLRIYHGRFEGLGRIEVAFNSEEEAAKFTPPDWFGKEITATPLARDNSLLDLTDKEFQKLLKECS